MKTEILITFVVMGLLIMAGYGKMAIAKSNEQELLWSNNGKNNIKKYDIKRVYQFMILISMISGAYLVYYLTVTSTPTQELQIIRYTGVVIFLSFSLIWAFAPFVYPKIVLFFVPIGLALIMASITHDKSTEGSLAIAATSILIVQSFIFDFVLWTGII